jgi:hypothetical protein
MSNSNYTLEIISHHPKFDGKALKKHYVEGIETVGAWGDEPFEIRFKNNTWQKVQVKISVDGTNVLTGKPADTLVSKDMWVVNGYAELKLKAWPETSNGGASFIFTSANNSVAVHTHGDLSNRGIIAAAVFTEGHVEPIKITPPIRVEEHHHHYPPYIPYTPPSPSPWYEPIWIYSTSDNTGSKYGMRRSKSFTSNNTYKSSSAIPAASGGGTYTSNSVFNNSTLGSCDAGATFDCFSVELSDADSRGLEELVSVGAGEHVDQKITYVAGLIKPTFTETVRVKYLWWDELQEKLRAHSKAQAQPSGFPGDVKHKNIDLKDTPRIGSKQRFHQAEPQHVFDRF